MLETIILCAAASLVFAGVRALLRDRSTPFWIDFISLGLALLVFASQSLLGWKL